MGTALRADAERNRRAILEAAARAIGEDPAVSIQQIADAAGCARATVYRRFPTREALVAAILEAAFDDTRAAMKAAAPRTGPAEDALRRVAAGLLEVADRWSLVSKSSNAEQHGAKARRAITAELQRLARRARDEGLLDPDLSPEWATATFAAVLRAAIERRAAGELRDLDAAADLVVRTFLRGVGAQPAGGG